MTKKKPPAGRGLAIRNSTAEFLIFTGQAGEESIEVRFEDRTIWLTQKLMAELFAVTVPTISEHLKNIFASAELDEQAVVRNFLTAAADGKNYQTRHYNLDVVISVGYRVNSVRATQFRQWATQVLREFAIKGWVLDRKRLENGTFLGEDYYERLLEEIREIRLSERRFYQKVTDIYSTSVDYNPEAPTTREFFAMVQNKLHFAIHGRTAAELILARADADRPRMGLATWEGAPGKRIVQSDVGVAKNYLSADELQALGRLVNSYLDLAEDRAQRRMPMTMEDWATQLDKFLDLTERGILKNAGRVSAEAAKTHAVSEFQRYRLVQERDYESDFDRVVKREGPSKEDSLKALEEIERQGKGRKRKPE